MLFKSSAYVVWQLCILFVNVYCDEADTFDDVTSSTHKLENIHSFFYKSTEEGFPSLGIQEKRNDQFTALAQPCNCKELDERNNQEAIFYKRLITILLSNLAVQEVDDRFIGTFSMEASSSQFEYLQKFVNGQGSIREVDRILVNVIKQSEYSILYYTNLLSQILMHCWSLLKEHWQITIISLTMIASFMILRRQRWSRGIIIFLIFDVIIITSFFITWWRLIQEAEIKLMAAQAQFEEMPIDCKPHKMGIWDKIVATFFHTNDCEKYYETLLTNPKLQVTPAFALTHFVTTTIFQPFSYFGLVISEFINNATKDLNSLYKIPIIIILYLTFCVLIVLLPFVLFGSSIQLGIGPFFKFGIKGRASPSKKSNVERIEHIERIYEHTSPVKKRLKNSEKIKPITFESANDLAGGDAGIGTHHLSKEHEKCKCKNEDRDGDENVEYEKKEEKSDDC